MPNNLWRWIERVSWWLEDADERQTVLGDIQERGVSVSALRQLIGLVLLRQLTAWKSWRPWALTAALLPITYALAYAPLNAAGWVYQLTYLHFGVWLNTETLLHLVNLSILPYAAGLSLGSIAKQRSLAIFPILVVCTVSAMTPLLLSNWVVPIVMEPWEIDHGMVVTAYREMSLQHLILLPTVSVAVVILLFLGWNRGLRGKNLRLPWAIFVATLLLTAIGTQIARILHGDAFYPLAELIFWPLLYPLYAGTRLQRQVAIS